jgi:hypothetical protein
MMTGEPAKKSAAETLSWEEFETQLVADPEFLAVIKANRGHPERLIRRDRFSSPRE